MAEEGNPDEPKEKSKVKKVLRIIFWVIFHVVFISYFIWCTFYYIQFDKTMGKHCFPNVKLFSRDLNDSETTEAIETTEPIEAIETTEPPKSHILCSLDFCFGYGFLIILFTVFYIFYIYYVFFKPLIGQKFYDAKIQPMNEKTNAFCARTAVFIVCLVIVVIIVGVIITIECVEEPAKLQALIGPVVFVSCGVLFSRRRKSIPVRLVVKGMFLQFMLGVFCIRWEFGRSIFKCVGEKAAGFLGFTRAGAEFVYGVRIMNDFVFAFAILAVIFFFSVVTSILYYLGWIQAVLRVMGWFLGSIMGTTVCESVNACGNIFLGMTESPLMIRPYLKDLTASELHAIMVAGFCTVAGTVLGAYIAFGASPAYLITASVMAAPASLAFAKLYFPETDVTSTSSDIINLQKSDDSTILEAVASGAAIGMMIVLGIVSNIVAVLALFAFMNAVVEWSFELAGVDNVTFLTILTEIFKPLAFIMGVPWNDCPLIAEVVAMKTVLNEFVAYMKLGEYIREDRIESRSAGIATFALCGFANPGSLGILVAALSMMEPSQRTVITKVAISAFFVGSFVSFTSASFAGILIPKEELGTMGKFFNFDAIDGDMSDFFYNV